jgi:hypothetical protein
MNGGCGTLAPAYLKMVKSCKRNKGRGAEQSVINSYQNGKKAYIDPNDPSVIYLQQPEVTQNMNYNPFGYQPIPQGPPMQVGPQQVNQNNMNYQPAPMPNMPNNNYPNYQVNQNQINQPPMNNMNNNMPPNYGNNINNNYPNFSNNNQQEEMDLPTSEEVYAQSNNNINMNQNQQYPEHGMGGLNGVINNQPQEGGKYFGFWGPSLDRNPNHPNNNNGQ